jgi:hypothetical protein
MCAQALMTFFEAWTNCSLLLHFLKYSEYFLEMIRRIVATDERIMRIGGN